MHLLDAHRMELFEAGRSQLVLVCRYSWLDCKLVVLEESEEEPAELRSSQLLLKMSVVVGIHIADAILDDVMMESD